MRRTLTIIASVIVLVGISVFIYLYFFSSRPTITVAPGGTLPIAGQGTNAGQATSTTSAGEPTRVTARLVKISVGPVVSGEAVINATIASSSLVTTVSYIERQSGNVFSYSTKTGTITRTNNQTVPGIQSAAWLPDASLAFVRYLSGDDFSTINTYALSASSDSTKQGFFLPQNISDLSVSSTSVLTLASGVNGSIASLGKTNAVLSSEIFNTTLSSLRASFAGSSHYLAFTKPSASFSGVAFIVDSAKNFSRIAGPLNGLVALASPLGKWVLVSYVQNNTMQMEMVNVASGEIVSLPIATIADKCVWTVDDSAIYCGIPVDPPSGIAYPDDWYQGAVSFSDRIWKIDVAGRYAQLVLDFPKETDDSLDATALAIDPLNTTLVFLNKNDLSLWSYQL